MPSKSGWAPCPPELDEAAPANEAPQPSLPIGAILRSPRQTHALNWDAVNAHLSAHGLELDRAFQPRQFAGGLANLNFLIRVNGNWAVLRRPPDGPLPRGAHDMVREHRILSQLWREWPLAPRSLHLCEDASFIGAPFQLLEFRAGIALRGDDLGPFPDSEETGARLSEMLVEMLAAIHAVDPERIGLADLGRPPGFFARTAAGWIDRAWRVARGSPSPATHAIAHWLRTTGVADAEAPTLLHCDLKLDNVLIDPETGAPVAVVDWDMGTRGDPLFDLATLLSYWTESGDPRCMHELGQMPTARSGFLTRAQAADAYAHATGRSLKQLKPYRVLTMLKLGVVFHQLHARHVAGGKSDPRYAGFGTVAEELLEFTLDIINDKAF